MKGYILSADDFGLAAEFNRGILELAQKGTLSGISVMINQKFGKAGDLLSLPNIDLGLHLELVSQSSEKEISAQLQKFKKKFHRLPDYLDGHQHCHLLPSNLAAVIRIATRYHLPVRSRFSEDRQMLRKAGIKTPDEFISWHPSRKEKFLEKIHAGQGVFEIVCHPGYEDSRTRYPYNAEREAELHFLKSAAFQKNLRNVPLMRYRNL